MLGCDPEIIPVDDNKQPRSIIGKLGGTKANPRQIGDIFLQEDNVNAEIGIVPARSFIEWNTRITTSLRILAKELERSKLFISTLASGEFLKEELVGDALIAGCTPDFDAWGLDMNIPPDISSVLLRSAGGHVQISHDDFGGYKEPPYRIDDIGAHLVPNRPDDNPMDGIYLVRALDFRLGLKSVLLDPDTKRKSLYGKAGCFRPKPFGIEYRTLSNFWIFDYECRKMVWDESHYCLDNYKKWALEPDTRLGQDIVKAINTNDKELAQNVLNYAV